MVGVLARVELGAHPIPTTPSAMLSRISSGISSVFSGDSKSPQIGEIERINEIEDWEKGQVLWISRGDGVVPSRVIQDEYRM